MVRSKEKTIEKYELALKKLMKEIIHPNFVAKPWLRNNHLSSVFMKAVEEGGYVDVIGKKGRVVLYKPNYNPEEINTRDAENVYEIMQESLKPKKVEKTEKPKVETHRIISKGEVKFKPLTEYPIANLIAELKRRGYEGEIRRLEIINFTPEK